MVVYIKFLQVVLSCTILSGYLHLEKYTVSVLQAWNDITGRKLLSKTYASLIKTVRCHRK